MVKSALLILACCLFICPYSEARVIGKAGMVYPILERDAIEELVEAAGKVNWKNVFNEANRTAAESFGRAGNEVSLPNAPENRTRRITMNYTLPFDVPDPSNLNRVLYPAGMSFNPLEYGIMYEKWIFLDATEPQQLQWFALTHAKHPSAVPILTGGNALEMEKRFKRPFYVATRTMLDRFQVQYVPCFAYQEGKEMVVEEFHVKK